MSAARAWGEALGRARIASVPADFRVTEQLGFSADGDGPHLLVEIEKMGLSTIEAMKRLATHWQVASQAMGYAGRKDRQAVSRQFLTLPWPVNADLPAPESIVDEADRALHVRSVARHRRKLRIGSLVGNRFELRLREVRGDRSALDRRLGQIARAGVPNYFGAQRFGRGGQNVAQASAWFAGKRRPRGRNERSMLLSAARSECFNQVLSARVEAGDWNQISLHDRVILDGRGSHFGVDPTALDNLQARCAGLNVHPTGPLPGTPRAGLVLSEVLKRRESALLQPLQGLIDGLIDKGVEADRRALRLRVAAMAWHWPSPDQLSLTFALARGAFATTVLRELIEPDASN